MDLLPLVVMILTMNETGKTLRRNLLRLLRRPGDLQYHQPLMKAFPFNCEECPKKREERCQLDSHHFLDKIALLAKAVCPAH